jgi:hypothetical protein
MTCLIAAATHRRRDLAAAPRQFDAHARRDAGFEFRRADAPEFADQFPEPAMEASRPPPAR